MKRLFLFVSVFVFTLLCAVMMFALPVSAEVYGGNCGAQGDNLKWLLDTETGVLEITGSGDMADWAVRKEYEECCPWVDDDGVWNYCSSGCEDCGPLQTWWTYDSDAPWCDLASHIKIVRIGADVTSIGNGAFLNKIDYYERFINEDENGFEFYDHRYHYTKSAYSLTTVEYLGTEAEWNAKVTVGTDNEALINALSFVPADDSTDDPVDPPTDNPTNIISGNCGAQGDNVKWILDIETGLLQITGCGEMQDCVYSAWPWHTYRETIKTVIIGDGVTRIGFDAFLDCSGLTSVTIPDSVISIGNGAFWDCFSLTTINLSNNLVSIETGAFAGCVSLTGIHIPDSVTSIGKNVFQCCQSLTDVTFGRGLSIIESGLFVNCTTLKKIVLPEGIISIGDAAFATCYELSSIILPSTLANIDRDAFYDCYELTEVCYHGTKAEWNASVTVEENNELLLNVLTFVAHTWDNGVITVEPTHLQKGQKTYTCACGQTRVETLPKIAEHSYGEWQEHTNILHKKVCECGRVECGVHEWDEGKVTKEPTQDAEGVKTHTCTICGATKTKAVTKSLQPPQSFSSWVMNGCQVSVAASSGVMMLLSLAGACLISKKKKD